LRSASFHHSSTSGASQSGKAWNHMVSRYEWKDNPPTVRPGQTSPMNND
jgi:hypothetical protein